MSAKEKLPEGASGQGRRRATYGFNVVLAVLAAAAVLVLVNLIVVYQVRHIRPELVHLVRYDGTATRDYSLSQQTIKVLRDLDESYRIVTLMDRASARSAPRLAAAIERTIDVVNDYARYSRHITVENIQPDLDVAKLQEFYQTLLARHEAGLAPVRAAMETAKTALEQLRTAAKAQQPRLIELAQSSELSSVSAKQKFLVVAAKLVQPELGHERVAREVNQALQTELPDYSAALGVYQLELSSYEQSAPVAMTMLKEMADAGNAPPSLKNECLELMEAIKQAQKIAGEALTAVRGAAKARAYDDLRGQLRQADTVVILSPQQERVLQLESMFRQIQEPADRTQHAQSADERWSFLGEELITGALVSLSLKQPPLVVFVSSGRQAPIGPGGSYEHVSQRLRKFNYQVESWSPAGRMGPMNQTLPPTPRPQPQAGQKAIWIVVPPDRSNPMGLMAGGDQIAHAIEERLAAGDSAMLMFGYSPGMTLGTTDPLAQVAQSWGIKVQQDRVVLQEITLPRSQTTVRDQYEVDQWPEDLSATKAIQGMTAIFWGSMPVEASSTAEVQTWPLVRIRGQGLWAQKNLEMAREVKLDPDMAADTFTVGVAAQKHDARMVVVADPIWATDSATTFAEIRGQRIAMEDAQALGIGLRFPGNAELFVNSVHWLAGLDRLIAASPRTQDVRRIGAISDRAMTTLRWTMLAGLPGLSLLTGLGVWLVRRRG